MIPPFVSLNTSDDVLGRIQASVARTLNPIVAIPRTQGVTLAKVTLAAGSNSIPHMLNRTLVGWSVARKRASADIYDTQDSNPTPQATLILVSSTAVVIDLEVW